MTSFRSHVTAGDDEDREDEHLITRLLLRVHASNLPGNGILRTPPSSFAQVTSISGRPSRSGPYYNDDQSMSAATMVWGQTEIIRKNKNPQWTETFEIDYEYGSECYFSVNVLRASSNKENKEHSSFGTATCEVGDILGSKNRTKVKRLPKGGVVFCRLEAVNISNHNRIARFQFQANINHSPKSLFSKLKVPPNTIFQISKRHPNAHRHPWLVVYRSSPVNESFEPKWDLAEMDLEALCNGDIDRPLRLRVLIHKKKRSKNDCLGECETTLRMILNTQLPGSSVDGFNMFKSMEDQKIVGRLDVPLAQVIDLNLEQDVMIDSFNINEADADSEEIQQSSRWIMDVSPMTVEASSPAAPSFSEYMEKGWSLDFMIAIDFTSSNGDPRVPGTPHDQATDGFNDYEECIGGIGAELSRYSEECTIWGFGAKFDGVTRHLFQLGSAETHRGSVDGILHAYRSIFESDLIMSGPTHFSQVIQAAAVRANNNKTQGTPLYSVLLILTDGISQDLEETQRKLNVYSSVPLSVIFVGLGRSDFAAMHNLVSTPGGGRKNLSFVEFRQHQHDPKLLGTEALRSIPSQFVEYMQLNGILPFSAGG